MKKVLAFVLFLSLALSLVACDATEPKEVSCEDIIQAYENAGYYVVHGEHKEEDDDNAELCYIKASISEDSDSDYIYFITCFTEEEAQAVAETDTYNLAIWLYAAIKGEHRWLKSGVYGKIEYSYYNSDLIEPFHELVE